MTISTASRSPKRKTMTTEEDGEDGMWGTGTGNGQVALRRVLVPYAGTGDKMLKGRRQGASSTVSRWLWVVCWLSLPHYDCDKDIKVVTS